MNNTNSPTNDKQPACDGAGAPGTGPSTPAGNNGTTSIRNNPAPHLAWRSTALRGPGIGRPPEPKSSRRRRTRMDLYGRDPEIPYAKFETADRDLICSLMERQDLMNEEIFYRINDLGYRLEDLEERVSASVGRS